MKRSKVQTLQNKISTSVADAAAAAAAVTMSLNASAQFDNLIFFTLSDKFEEK